MAAVLGNPVVLRGYLVISHQITGLVGWQAKDKEPRRRFEVCTCFLAQYDYSHDADLDDQILYSRAPKKAVGCRPSFIVPFGP